MTPKQHATVILLSLLGGLLVGGLTYWRHGPSAFGCSVKYQGEELLHR